MLVFDFATLAVVVAVPSSVLAVSFDVEQQFGNVALWAAYAAAVVRSFWFQLQATFRSLVRRLLLFKVLLSPPLQPHCKLANLLLFRLSLILEGNHNEFHHLQPICKCIFLKKPRSQAE